jgi:hypothetical protein
MAITFTDNTARNKRASVLGIDGIYRMVLPVPDGTIDAADRWQITGKRWMAPAALPGGGWGPGRPSREEVYIRLREALFGKEFDDVDEAAILAAVIWTLSH